MKKILVGVLAASLLVPTVVFAGNEGALAPGKPAGVRAAQGDNTAVWVGVGAAALVLGGALAASNCCKLGNPTVPAATSTTAT